MLTYLRAVVIGLVQGVTELFPVSSLGHSVLVAALLGWDDLVKAQSANESFFLAFLVALHVGTAIALFIYFFDEWRLIGSELYESARQRRVVGPNARLGLLLVVATIPAGLTGLVFEHALRTFFAKPFAAACFLLINGLLLGAGEVLRRRTGVKAASGHAQADNPEPGRRIDTLTYGEAVFIGIAQIGALFAGISRSGITMVAGLARGLDHEDAARFSFLLATPIIAAAGVYKLPDLVGHLGNGVRGQALVGAIAAGVSAYASTRFLLRFFRNNTLWPFAVYCIVVGGACMVYFA